MSTGSRTCARGSGVRRAAVALAVAVLSCEGKADRSGHERAPVVECPSEAFIESLHAAAFHFERGDHASGRAHFDHAMTMDVAQHDEIARRLVAQLSEVSRRGEADPSWTLGETEQMRATFGDWHCLPETSHRAFHERLPPTQP
jgi:hypothetical protein